MKKMMIVKSKHKEPSDFLDWSCVELQERDLLENQSQELAWALKEEEEFPTFRR